MKITIKKTYTCSISPGAWSLEPSKKIILNKGEIFPLETGYLDNDMPFLKISKDGEQFPLSTLIQGGVVSQKTGKKFFAIKTKTSTFSRNRGSRVNEDHQDIIFIGERNKNEFRVLAQRNKKESFIESFIDPKMLIGKDEIEIKLPYSGGRTLPSYAQLNTKILVA